MAGNKRDKQAEGLPAVAPVRIFRSQEDWNQWLEKNHRTSSGLWLKLAKRGSGLQSVTYSEALETALCYGWIDAQKKPDTEQMWLQRFVPRSSRSIWSKINREKAEALIQSGRMHPAGLEAIACAKQNGQWEGAYDSPSKATVPEDLQRALDASPRAKDFFATLNAVNRYAILFRVQTARKAETREKRIRTYIEMLERREKLHP
jgi:uncharacterized protein YdeI (YjbR/CyaY-like superfamily)